MMMNTKLIRCGFIIFTFLFFTNCSEDDPFSLTQISPEIISEADFWKTAEDAVQASNALYDPLTRLSLESNIMFLNTMDEFAGLLQGNPSIHWEDAYYYVHTSTNSISNLFWSRMYNWIYRSNYLLENIEEKAENITGMTDELKKGLMAEAYFFRGFALSYLAFYYGDAPIPLETAKTTDTRFEQKTAQEVWDQAIADFKSAAADLPETRSGDPGDEVGRVTRFTALAFLGKAYLYMATLTKNWPDENYGDAGTLFGNAAAELKKIIDYAHNNPNQIGLIENYQQNFTTENENNKESLLEAQLLNTVGSINDFSATFGPLSVVVNPYMQPNPLVYSEFIKELAEDGNYDKRMYETIYFKDENHPVEVVFGDTVKEENFLEWKKHQDAQLDAPLQSLADNNHRIMRYSDVLLMYAEAICEQGTVNQEAIDAVDAVRKRAGLKALNETSINTSSAFEMIQEIRHQRSLEFMLENMRWNDITRWNIVKERLSLAINREEAANNYQDKHRWYPIPLSELLYNDNVQQNPKWQ